MTLPRNTTCLAFLVWRQGIYPLRISGQIRPSHNSVPGHSRIESYIPHTPTFPALPVLHPHSTYTPTITGPADISGRLEYSVTVSNNILPSLPFIPHIRFPFGVTCPPPSNSTRPRLGPSTAYGLAAGIRGGLKSQSRPIGPFLSLQSSLHSPVGASLDWSRLEHGILKELCFPLQLVSLHFLLPSLPVKLSS